MRGLLLASILFAFSGCDESVAGPTVQLDREFTLAPGDSSVVDGISIRFARVASDSRCPADATCVWMGNAQVQIVVTSQARSRGYDLNTSDMKPVAHEGYTIHLVKLEPYPYSSKTIEPSEYRVTLKVTN